MECNGVSEWQINLPIKFLEESHINWDFQILEFIYFPIPKVDFSQEIIANRTRVYRKTG